MLQQFTHSVAQWEAAEAVALIDATKVMKAALLAPIAAWLTTIAALLVRLR